MAEYELCVSPGAAGDLDRVHATDPDSAAFIAIIIQELHDNPKHRDWIVRGGFSDDDIESVSEFWYLQDRKINAYRVRVVLIPDWRIITAVDHRWKCIGVFGIMHRSQDYERDQEFCSRIEREYDDLGFRRL